MDSDRICFLEILPCKGARQDPIRCHQLYQSLDTALQFTVVEPEPEATRHLKEARIFIDDQEIDVSNSFVSALEQLQYLERPRHILLLDLCARLTDLSAPAGIPSISSLLPKSKFVGLWKPPPHPFLLAEKEEGSLVRHASSPLSIVITEHNLRHYSPYSRGSRITPLVSLECSGDASSTIDCKTVYACWPALPSFTMLSEPWEELEALTNHLGVETVRLDGRDRRMPYLKCEALRKLRSESRSELILQYEIAHYPLEKTGNTRVDFSTLSGELHPTGSFIEALGMRKTPDAVYLDGSATQKKSGFVNTILHRSDPHEDALELRRTAMIRAARSYLATWIHPESLLDHLFAQAGPENFADILNNKLDVSELFVKLVCFPRFYHRKRIDTSLDSSEIRLLAVDKKSLSHPTRLICHMVQINLNEKHPPFVFHKGRSMIGSWTYGTEDLEQLQRGGEIILDGVLQVVDEGLLQVVRAIQHDKHASYIWSESMCVNWEIRKETKHHVRLREKILKHAIASVEITRGQSNLMAASQLNSFRYTALRKEQREIRLLKFDTACSSPAETHCHLAVTELATAEYTAISYCWGSASEAAYLQINEGQVLVTPSVIEMLRTLREDLDGRWFWVDAICINQSDHTEKGHQVAMMTEIYQNASNVILWLGAEAHNSEKAMELLEKVSELSQTDHEIEALRASVDEVGSQNDEKIAQHGKYEIKESQTQLFLEERLKDDSICICLIELLRRPWWERLWTFQEAALAQNACLRLGSKSIEWQDFEYVHRALEIYEENRTTESRLKDYLKLVVEKIGKFLRLARLDKSWRNSNRASSPESGLRNFQRGGGFSSLAYMSILRKRHCSNPADYVYCTIGLASDGLDLVPDYNKSLLEVYLDFAKTYILRRGELDVLRFATFRKLRHSNLSLSQTFLPFWPSWVPDWRASSDGFGAITRLDNWESIAQLDEIDQPFSLEDRASGALKSTTRFSHQDRVIHVKGLQIGKVSKKLSEEEIKGIEVQFHMPLGDPLHILDKLSVRFVSDGEKGNDEAWNLGLATARLSQSTRLTPTIYIPGKLNDERDAFHAKNISESEDHTEIANANTHPVTSEFIEDDNAHTTVESQNSKTAREKTELDPNSDIHHKTLGVSNPVDGDEQSDPEVLSAENRDIPSPDNWKPTNEFPPFKATPQPVASVYRLDNDCLVSGSDAFESGDIVCVLFGGRVPFVLRPWHDFYLLMGNCNAPGWMKGEALEKIGEANAMEFGIV